MDEQKPKIEGWRKMGIAMGSITALSLQTGIDFKIAVIIGAIAIYGITAQAIVDWKK